MSKRKRASRVPGTPASTPTTDDSVDDASVKDDMVHVTPDILAGSPDIFATKKGAGPNPEPAAVAEPATPEAAAEAGAAADVEASSAHVESTEANTTLTHEGDVESGPSAEPRAAEPAAETPTEALPEAPSQPAFVATMPPAALSAEHRRGGSSIALGVVLVVLGAFALVIVGFGIDLTQYGWPLFVIVPGLTLLVVGFVGLGAGASIPGGIVTMLGLVLAYQNYSDDWPSWAFAWALVVPFGVGLGMYLQALRDRDMPALRRGRMLMFVGVLIFLIGFVFFESILGISGRDYGGLGKAGLPVLLIVIGVILLVRSIQRSRRPHA